MKEFLVFVFYFIGIAAILWELMAVFTAGKVTQFRKGLKKLKGKKFDDYSDTQQCVTILQFGYIFWVFVGVFGSQWIVFLLILLMGMIPKKMHKAVTFIDGFLTAGLLLFAIINQYHLHINLLELVKGWIF